jgi:hypothetical protein
LRTRGGIGDEGRERFVGSCSELKTRGRQRMPIRDTASKTRPRNKDGEIAAGEKARADEEADRAAKEQQPQGGDRRSEDFKGQLERPSNPEQRAGPQSRSSPTQHRRTPNTADRPAQVPNNSAALACRVIPRIKSDAIGRAQFPVPHIANVKAPAGAAPTCRVVHRGSDCQICRRSKARCHRHASGS